MKLDTVGTAATRLRRRLKSCKNLQRTREHVRQDSRECPPFATVLASAVRRAGIATTVLLAVGLSILRAIADDPSKLNAEGNDRIVQHNYAIDSAGEANTYSILLTNGSAAATQLLSVSNSIDGKKVSQNFAGRTTSVQVSPFTGPGAYTVDATLPNGVSTHATYGPMGISSIQRKDANGIQTGQTTFSTDAAGLNVQIQDSTRGLQHLTFDLAGRLSSIDASSGGGTSATVEYLSGTDLPTRITGGGKTWTCQYYPNGLPKHVTCTGSPDTDYTWDTMARLSSMTLTTSTGTCTTTTWNRDPHNGRLVNKMVNGNVVETYAWRANGQPDTVTRPTGTIQNQYNSAGDPTALVDTPANYAAETVTTAYDRPGNVITSAVTSGIAEGYTRHIDGTLLGVQVLGSSVVPDHAVVLPQNLASGKVLGYCLTQGGTLRNLTVSYNAASFVTNVIDGNLAGTYDWTPGGSTTNLNLTLAGVPCLTIQQNWNEALGVRTNMAYSVNGVPIASFAFDRGPGTNQITKITREDGSTREISYDGSGRLVGWKYKTAAGVADFDRSWLYGYDGAGNLISSGHDPSVAGGPVQMSPMAKNYATKSIRLTTQFDVDEFNFHTVRRWNAVDLVCYAAANARVTVNGMPARQKGTRYVVSIPLASNTVATVTNLTVCAVLDGGTNAEYYYTNTVQLTLPAFPETIQTAMASAVISDSVMEYVYDARNQLRRVTDKVDATAIRLQSTFDYYPNGRRARKTVTVWDGSTWQPYRICQYIYDRWNLIREIVTENGVTTTRDYTWGLDQAGMQDGQWGQGQGGIGGLLAVTEVVTKNQEPGTTNIFLTVCDQVGTIQALVAAVTNNVTLATPVIVATYEYSPYGELIAVDGPYANSCPIGFMSKYRDSETGLVFFQLRPYEPRSGKWLTTDPFGLAGGLNGTELCGGDPVNSIDALGLATWAGVKAYINEFIRDDPVFQKDLFFAQWVNGLDSGAYAGVVAIDEGSQDKSHKGVINITDNEISFSGDKTDQEVAWALARSHLWTLSRDALSSMRVNANIGGASLSYAEAMANAGVSANEEMTRMLKVGGLAAGETMATVASVGDLAAAKELAGGLVRAGISATEGMGKLTFDAVGKRWISKAGVIYGQGSLQGNRVLHLMEHLTPNSAKKIHSVFNMQQDELLGAIDEAWLKRGVPLSVDSGAFVVPMGRTVGTAGERSIKIIVRPGTSELITAYPIE